MVIKLDINDRAANAIRNGTKKVEIRSNVNDIKFRPDDIIEFTSNNIGVFYVRVEEVNYYKTIEELLTLEGTRYTTSSTNVDVVIYGSHRLESCK